MKGSLRISKGSAKHITHSFDAKHIDKERTEKNIYYTWKNGITTADNIEADEMEFYEKNYGEYLYKQNKKYEQKRQYKRMKNMKEYYEANKPDEVILQVGKMGETIEPELLEKILNVFLKNLKKKYGENIHVLSYSLHADEATPHIHLRITYDYLDKGVRRFGINKALEELGFKQPKAEKKESRYNNKKISFTDTLRTAFYDFCEMFGIEINRTVENPSHRYLEAQLYKGQKQQEKNTQLEKNIEALEQKLIILEKKFSDTENENDGLITVNKQLLENIEKSRKELEQLKSENEKTRIDGNRLTEYLNRCMATLVKAEELDKKALGYSPLTKHMDELRENISDMNRYGKNSNDSR